MGSASITDTQQGRGHGDEVPVTTPTVPSQESRPPAQTPAWLGLHTPMWGTTVGHLMVALLGQPQGLQTLHMATHPELVLALTCPDDTNAWEQLLANGLQVAGLAGAGRAQ